MASLRKDRSGNYLVAFRWAGIQFTRSLDTKDEAVARAGVNRAEETIMRLKKGWAIMPEGAEAGAFIVSGGEVDKKPTRREVVKPLSIGELFDQYERDLPAGTKEDSTRLTERIHLKHVREILGEKTAAESLRVADVLRYHDRRVNQKWRGKATSSQTVRKELVTLRALCVWGHKRGHLAAPPAWTWSDVDAVKGEAEREPFRTLAEIRERIARNNLAEPEQRRLFECLYLTGPEIRELLAFVHENAIARFVHPMVVTAALTGARRSELCRSRIDDVDLGGMHFQIRERKRDRTRKETLRTVELNPMLAQVLREWLDSHPGGPFTFAQADGSPITKDEATDHLKRTLRRSEQWKHVPGFHTFRHSFASILASRGHDQRVIDRLLGHQTEAMRKRYQHLFPRQRRAAVDDLLSLG
jgi:integrase